MKKYLHVLILLSIGYIINGQHIKVSLSGDWEEGAEIKLNGFYGLKMYSIDSSFTYVLETDIPDSILKANFMVGVFKDKSLLYKHAILYDHSDIELELHSTGRELKTEWKKPGLNQLYEHYKHNNDSIEDRIQTLLHLYSYGADTNSPFYQKLYLELENSADKLQDNFIKLWEEHPKDALGDYIRNLFFELPDFKLPEKERMLSMRSHFFDYYNPLDEIVLHSSLYKSKLEDFLALSESIAMYDSEVIDQELIMDALDEYLILLVENEPIQSQTLSSLWDKYHYKSLDEITKYLDENWIATQCHAEDDLMLQERLESYQRLAEGKPAPDLEFTGMLMNEESTYHLSDFKGKKIVLVFWASWCPHCEEMLPKVKAFTDKRLNIKVVTVGLDEVRKDWINAIQRYPGWIHIQGKEKWDSPWARNYSIYATPTFYVIDEDTKMIGKANNVNELKRLLNRKQ